MESEGGREYWNAAVSMTPVAQEVHSIASLTRPYDDSPLDITFFVACENAAPYVKETLQMLADTMEAIEGRGEILVIDDASTDDSARHVREFMLDHPELSITLRINPQPKWLAQNYYDAAFLGKGQYLQLVYADSAETMETMVDILRSLGDADILIPYYIDSLHKESSGQNLPKLYASVLNYFTKYRIKDYSLAAVHLRYNVMRWHGNTTGHGFQVELLCRLLDMGFTYKQMPSRSVERHASRLTRSTLFLNIISVGQTVFHIVLRRIAARFTE